jgi:hypothetical protein
VEEEVVEVDEEVVGKQEKMMMQKSYKGEEEEEDKEEEKMMQKSYKGRLIVGNESVIVLSLSLSSITQYSHLLEKATTSKCLLLLVFPKALP